MLRCSSHHNLPSLLVQTDHTCYPPFLTVTPITNCYQQLHTVILRFLISVSSVNEKERPVMVMDCQERSWIVSLRFLMAGYVGYNFRNDFVKP